MVEAARGIHPSEAQAFCHLAALSCLCRPCRSRLPQVPASRSQTPSSRSRSRSIQWHDLNRPDTNTQAFCLSAALCCSCRPCRSSLPAAWTSRSPTPSSRSKRSHWHDLNMPSEHKHSSVLHVYCCVLPAQALQKQFAAVVDKQVTGALEQKQKQLEAAAAAAATAAAAPAVEAATAAAGKASLSAPRKRLRPRRRV